MDVEPGSMIVLCTSIHQGNMGCQHKCRKAGHDGERELSSVEAEPGSVSG